MDLVRNYRFKEEGADVKVVGAARQVVYLQARLPVTVDVQADSEAVEFDAIVVRWLRPDMMRRHAPMVASCARRRSRASGRRDSATPWMLVSQGSSRPEGDVVFSIKDDLVAAGPTGWTRGGRGRQPDHDRASRTLPRSAARSFPRSGKSKRRRGERSRSSRHPTGHPRGLCVTRLTGRARARTVVNPTRC